MSDLLLSKPTLPYGWVDVSVGEPHVVREILMETFDISEYELPNVSRMYEYPEPQGYKPLVQLLEEKHGAPVIVTNGAKQALGAVFYALNRKGWNSCLEKSPYWALIPPLAKMHDIEMCHYGLPNIMDDLVPYLLISPNNPDGSCESPEKLLKWSDDFKRHNVPFIHDAAYYTHTYLPSTHTLPPIGDVQIYSISKMLGLSGLRLGYVVCHNPEFYKLILQYVEAMTVGASIVSQVFLSDLMKRMRGYPTLTQNFEGGSALALQAAKKEMLGVSSLILEVPPSVLDTNGMFGWFKKGPKFDQDKAKVNFIDGAPFGNSDYIRMNLAWNATAMADIVKRLNSTIET